MKITTVVDLIKSAEGGPFLDVYDDATGKPVLPGHVVRGTLTIGYGHTAPDLFPGMTISADQAEEYFRIDIGIASRDAQDTLGHDAWALLDPVRQAALIDMAFEMGEYGLCNFDHMLSAVRGKDWQLAHDEALKSLWATEVPSRAKRDAAILLTGNWP